MNKKIKILQIGENNWNKILSDKHLREVDWIFINTNLHDLDFQNSKYKEIDVMICTDTIDEEVLNQFHHCIEPYSLIIDKRLERYVPSHIINTKSPVFMDFNKEWDVIDRIALYFFSDQRGSKLSTPSIIINQFFEGEKILYGQHRLKLKGNFSDIKSNFLLTWGRNIWMNGKSQKLWLEFSHSAHVNLTMTIVTDYGLNGEQFKTWTYSHNEIRNGIEVKIEEGMSHLNVSLMATGEGWLEIGPLHFRDSHGDYGEYLLGGKKFFDYQNEEIFYYFHPGDLKPPLNVYFAGYHSAEGFEGFYMMKKLGAPFILITDPRLEGGSFYLGSKELENKLIAIILKYLDILNFTTDDLILSGLSMGTFGALYYSAYLSPRFVILGKPLANLGTVASNEQLVRPGGFPTSLDILYSLTGSLTEDSILKLNKRFWDTFRINNFDSTKFIISYMINDDYDDSAYYDILEYLSDKNSLIIGKGLIGRHNDNSSGIIEWFLKQYEQLLREDFKRGRKDEL